MLPTNRKYEIIEQIRATHQPLEEALAALSEEQMTEPGVNGEWTVKDMLAHITWWEQHLLRRLRSGQDDVYTEAALANTDGRTLTDQTNAQVFAANQSRPLEAVLSEFQTSYLELVNTLSSMAEEALANDEIYDAIGADTFRHYPEHTAMLQAWADQKNSSSKR
ncbi:MAG TPA: DinB family protein [Ktedonobacterales bacterium]|nr:DinB family protein [Ktedonobacterales bacterium]